MMNSWMYLMGASYIVLTFVKELVKKCASYMTSIFLWHCVIAVIINGHIILNGIKRCEGIWEISKMIYEGMHSSVQSDFYVKVFIYIKSISLWHCTTTLMINWQRIPNYKEVLNTLCFWHEYMKGWMSYYMRGLSNHCAKNNELSFYACNSCFSSHIVGNKRLFQWTKDVS